MQFQFAITEMEHEPGTLFDDASGYGVYIKIGSDDTYEWFKAQGFEGNGYTILALVDSLCRLELSSDVGSYEMEAEADNTWIYGPDKAPLDRLVAKFKKWTKDEASVRKLIKNASKKLME